MIVDVHAHVFMLKAFEKARTQYPIRVPHVIRDAAGRLYHLFDGQAYGPIPAQIYDTEKRIKDMKDEGVDLQILSAVPFTFFYSMNLGPSLALAQAQNDEISKLVNAYPERFAGLATVPLQDVAAAVAELDRAVKDLGMKGVEIGTHVGGQNLDWFELWPFYEKVQELDVPILVHPESPAGSERMKKYYLTNFIGFPMETSLAASSIIFGGVLERFERLKFCFVHGGGYIPYQRGRLEHGYEVRPEPKVEISKPPSEYVKLLYFDTTTHYQPALEYLTATVGSEQVIMGSDYPYDMADPHPVSSVRRLKSVSQEDKEKILGGNAVRIFKIRS